MAREIYSSDVRTGRNASLTTYRDRYVRCWNCDYVCNLDRDDRSHEGARDGDGITTPTTTLDGAVATTDTTITVDSTTGFSSSGYIYIYTSGQKMDRVAYTGTTSTTFTGCTGITVAHSDGDVVNGETDVNRGCPFCGTLLYDK